MTEERDRQTRAGAGSREEISAAAFDLLRDSYYRISYIDLSRNEIRNLKIVESEREDEERCDGVYDRLILNCAEKHVHAGDREKFLQLLRADNLRNFFAVRRDAVTFSYQRLVDGEYRWVQTEVVPLDDYLEESPRVIWYVKNITEEKVREAEYHQAMLQKNAGLQEANASLRKQMAIIGSLSDIYLCCYEVNLAAGEYREINAKSFVHDRILPRGNLREGLRIFRETFVQEGFQESIREFTDVATLRQRMQDTNIISVEYPGRTISWCRFSVIAVERDETGGLAIALIVSQDISGEKAVEEKLSRRLYRDLQERNKKLSDTLVMMNQMTSSLRSGIMAYTLPDYEVLLLNDEAKRIIGYEEGCGVKAGALLDRRMLDQDRDGMREAVKNLRQPGDSADYSFRVWQDDGSLMAVDARTKYLAFDDGTRFILSSIQDVTKQANLTRALDFERKQYRDALTMSSEFGFGVDLTDGFLREDFRNREGRKIVETLGLSLPASLDTFFEACEDRFRMQPLNPGTAKVWRREELIRAYGQGETNVETEYYLKGEDRYLRYSILLSQDDETEHIHAFIIGRDITSARKQEETARQALEQAYEAANAASAAKTDFLSNMSHDIRTPMNAIIGMTAIAASHLDDRDRVADSLKKITVSSRHLLGLINEILDMSKIEAGKMVLNEEAFNLSELLANLLTMIQPQVREHGHELQVRIHDIVHEDVVGDSLRIQQAFVNIMGNAIKYTPDGGRIVLTVTEKPVSQARTGCYEFIFEDNGIGMTREYIEKIFVPFSRAEDSRISKIQGTGLGMTITRNIVRMMNGDIEVESEPGKGSRFTATVYLKLQDGELQDTSGLEGLSVLVADDDQISCESTCSMLKEIGMDAEWVLSGRAAVDQVMERHNAAQDYSAVILDWKMPDMSGVETAKEIRRALGNDIPIIILSAYDWTDIEYEARAAGVNAFLCKPVFKSGLTRLFKSLTGGKTPEPERGETVQETMEASDFTGKRVLLAEDNDINREIATEVLGMTGLTVEEAVDGKQAVDLFEQSAEGYYDLVLMDIQMPVMNGYQAAAAIRSMKRQDAGRVPILAMTANAFAEDVLAAKNAGMNEHLAKPIDFQKLMGALEHWLRQ